MTNDAHESRYSPTLCCSELENFVHIFQLIRPPQPGMRIGQVEVYGDSVFLNRSAGGDHIIYVDFEQRYDIDRRILEAEKAGDDDVAARLEECRGRLGILVADVSGHQITDALAAAMLHQAFLTGVLYELDRSGEVTTRLFENLNTRFYNSLYFEKYITLVYGEISGAGMFHFLSASGPPPLVFSAEYDRFVTICPDRLVTFSPLGVLPSEGDIETERTMGSLGYKPSYTVNEVNLLSVGDILVLHTDGLSEHTGEDGQVFVPGMIEATLRANKHLSAREIFKAVRQEAMAFAPAADDITVVIIKKTQGDA